MEQFNKTLLFCRRSRTKRLRQAHMEEVSPQETIVTSNTSNTIPRHRYWTAIFGIHPAVVRYISHPRIVPIQIEPRTPIPKPRNTTRFEMYSEHGDGVLRNMNTPRQK